MATGGYDLLGRPMFDQGCGHGDAAMMRCYDKKTGKLRWETCLECAVTRPR